MDRFIFTNVSKDDHIRQHVNRRLTEEISKCADDSLYCDGASVTPYGECADLIPAVNDIPSGNIWHTLNSLRILHQFCSTLATMCNENPFLHGKPETCPSQLEWLAPLCRPMERIPEKTPDGRDNPRRAQLIAVAQGFPYGASLSEQVYYARVGLACRDVALTRLLLEREFPDSSEYEVHVCDIIMQQMCNVNEYDTWRDTFLNWRAHGLYYPLCVSSRYMEARQWVPVGTDREIPMVTALTGMLDSMRRNTVNSQDIQCFCNVYNRDNSPVSTHVADTLDRLAIHMRIKSNGSNDKGFDLDACLKAFPTSFGEDQVTSNYKAWFTLKGLVEETFPPCVFTCKSRRPTWGYSRLSLQVTENKVVSFQERKLEWVDRVYPGVPDPDMRVADVLSRVGDIVTSREVAACVLHPKDTENTVREAQRNEISADSTYHPSVDGRSAFLRCMEDAKDTLANNLTHFQDFRRCMETLEKCAPGIKETVYDIPQTMIVWRVDIPPRAIIYTGGQIHEMLQVRPSRHMLSKIIVNNRISGSVVGDAHFLGSKKTPVEINMLRAMSNYCRDNELHNHPFNSVSMRNPDGSQQRITLTTLPEAMSCFVLHPPFHRNRLPIGGVSPWVDESIDHRYSEIQEARNGIRLRDWTAMHVDSAGTHQARLAGHALEYTRLYTSMMPWFQDGVGLKWVKITSTQPPHNLVIKGKTLRQSVETRYFHDTRMLPLGDRERLAVTRENCEIYSSTDNKVVIAYAPTLKEGEPSRNESIDVAIFEDHSQGIKTQDSNPEGRGRRSRPRSWR